MKAVVSNKTLQEAINNSNYQKDKLIKAYSLAILDSYDFKGKIAVICGNNDKGLIGIEVSKELDSDLYITKDCNEIEKAFIIYENTDLSKYDIIIDALVDSNYTGIIDEYTNNIIILINNSHKTVISIDINSGLNPINGIGKHIVKSNLTVSLNNLRYGHFLNMAKDNIKEIINYSFNLKIDSNRYLLELPDFKGVIRERPNYSNKYDYGVVCILGGSNNFSGAVKLANMSSASIRSGVGVSRLAVPASMAQSVLSHVVESTVQSMESKFGQMIFNENNIKEALDNTTCLVVGMGWGSSIEYYKILNYILTNYDKPIVIDADGINTLKDMDLSILKNYKNKVIITPHLKEFSRISKLDTTLILDNPIKSVEEFAKKWNITVVLKGPSSIVSDGETTYIINKGCSGMATAGSGDVLSGILGGLLSWNEYSLKLVAEAAYINGLAGEEAEKEFGSISMMATDTINKIPNAIHKIETFKDK